MKLSDAVKAAKRVYIIGNGGSYANAVHICNDLLACGIKAYSLDPATLTASANDYGHDTVFSRWIGVVGERGDLLIALSGSGKSPNILNALRSARDKGLVTVGLTGRLGHDGSRRRRLAGAARLRADPVADQETRRPRAPASPATIGIDWTFAVCSIVCAAAAISLLLTSRRHRAASAL